MSSRTDDTPVLLYGVIHILIRMCFVVLRCKPTPSLLELHKVCFVKYRGLSRNQTPLEQIGTAVPIQDEPGVSHIEVLNVKVHVFVLLLFATLPDCSQNQTAVSDTLRLLSDF